MKSVTQARAEGRAPIGAALAGAGVGLGLGALFLAAGMAGHAADYARAQRIAEAAVSAYAESVVDPEDQGLDLGVERYGAAPGPDAQVMATRFETGRGGAAARRQSDLDCLAQAVYYEARGESARGQAAVAEVVLNRVKHPAFPRSVCAVVYQGASRKGCQFSFACDGSMNRRREPLAWKRARDVAARALAGAAGAEIGSATHFHTTAVSPTWAPQMLRVASVGTHVFYKFAPRRLRATPVTEPAQIVLASAASAMADAADLRVVPALALEKVSEASLEPKPATAATDAKAAKPVAGGPSKAAQPPAPKPAQTAAAETKSGGTTAAQKPAPAKAAAPATTDAAALTAPQSAGAGAS